MKTTKYNLTAKEQYQLRIVCNYTRLSFHAMAARPIVARGLIAEHYPVARLNSL